MCFTIEYDTIFSKLNTVLQEYFTFNFDTEKWEVIFMKNWEELKLQVNPKLRTTGRSNVACSISNMFPENIHELAILQEYLAKVGISLSVTKHEYTDIMSFVIDFDTFDKVTGRNAGRKKDRTMGKRYKECTVSELKTKLQTMKNCDIIAELECPKITFYRIMKNIKSAENEGYISDNDSIWEYTS